VTWSKLITPLWVCGPIPLSRDVLNPDCIVNNSKTHVDYFNWNTKQIWMFYIRFISIVNYLRMYVCMQVFFLTNYICSNISPIVKNINTILSLSNATAYDNGMKNNSEHFFTGHFDTPMSLLIAWGFLQHWLQMTCPHLLICILSMLCWFIMWLLMHFPSQLYSTITES
jgi:hypothetical protein